MVDRQEIHDLVTKYFAENKPLVKDNQAPVSGKVFDEKELISAIDAVLDQWWTDGDFSSRFEKKLKTRLGVNHCSLVNSGSSANLVAFSSLTSPRLNDKKIQKGDEIITVAACFPTTVNPIIQHGCIPCFFDIDQGTYNINVDEIEENISEKTKGIFLAHTLGNPFNVEKIMKLKKKYDLWLIEDNCDALGSKYDGQYTGSFGDFGTQSFYPAHHITTGEGGAIFTNDKVLNQISESIRDWGRDCWCLTGKENTCGERFSRQHGNLPFGYDHKYVFSHLGYNLKITDLQSAIGLAQVEKLDSFTKKRQSNFNYFVKRLREDALDTFFMLPEILPKAEPSWFGLPLTIKDPRIERRKLIEYLTENSIGVRLIFAGNITKQPYFIDYKVNYKIANGLSTTDNVMNNSFWIGVYPGLDVVNLEYIIRKLKEFTNEAGN